MLRPLDLIDDPTGNIGPQPLDGAAVMRPRRRPTHPEHRRASTAPSRRRAHPRLEAPEVGHQGGPVGPPRRLALVGQARPRPRAHHPGEEAFGLLARVVGHRRPRRAPPTRQPRRPPPLRPVGTPATASAARTPRPRRTSRARPARPRSPRRPPGCARRTRPGPPPNPRPAGRTSSITANRSSIWPPNPTTPPPREPW